MNKTFLELYEKLSLLYEDFIDGEQNIKVKIKDNFYYFVTDFMTKSEVESLYGLPLLKSPGIYIFKYTPIDHNLHNTCHYYVGKATELQDRIKAH